MKNLAVIDMDFQFLFQSVPGLYLVLSPDLQIIAVSDAYLDATMTVREQIAGKYLFEVFPDNPDDPTADGVSNLRSSIEKVIYFKRAHQMDIQKYDIRRPDGSFEIRYWSPLNKPVLNNENELLYIIHSVEDVTEKYFMEKRSETSELLLQSSIESLKDTLIFSIDLNYRYLNFNTAHKQATYTVYGIEIEVGMSLLAHITNESDRQKAKRNFDLAFQGTSHITVEEYGDLEHFYFETRYNPVVNEIGEVIGATVFSHNISERIKQEQLVKEQSTKLREINKELESSNELFSKLFNLNPASIAISRLNDATILDVNQAFLDMFEFESKQDVLDKTAEQIQILISESKRTRIINELLKNKRVVNIEDKYQTKNKLIKWSSSSVQLIEIAETPCLLSVMIDISQRKEQEKLLNKQKEELSLLNKELESFSYSVSHDLKAPLRSLQGFSRALLENYHGKFDEDADRWLRFIEVNAKRMDALIQDILEFSKVSRANIKISEINMYQSALEVFESEKSYYEHKNIDFIINEIPTYYGDSSMLKQVWQNLISNAIKYSSKNDMIRISVRAWVEEGYQVYSVSDNGVGFEDKYKDKLFGVFQRLHSNDEFDGTGVGLAIVKRIIQKHGGWITANSELGKGSEFKFGLPT